MYLNPSITDADRAAFLRKLDGSDLNVSEWEGDFLLNFMGAGAKFFWTDARRLSVDKMRMKYGGEPEIKMPYPLEISAPAKHAEADAGCCEFLVRLDGRQQPATIRQHAAAEWFPLLRNAR